MAFYGGWPDHLQAAPQRPLPRVGGSYWQPDDYGASVGASTSSAIDPSYLSHAHAAHLSSSSSASLPGAAFRPSSARGPSSAMFQGSLWAASEPSSASLTPWRSRGHSPTPPPPDLVRGTGFAASDGASTPSSSGYDSFPDESMDHPYRHESASAFTVADPSSLFPPLPRPHKRSSSPMLGYTPSAAALSSSPSLSLWHGAEESAAAGSTPWPAAMTSSALPSSTDYSSSPLIASTYSNGPMLAHSYDTSEQMPHHTSNYDLGATGSMTFGNADPYAWSAPLGGFAPHPYDF